MSSDALATMAELGRQFGQHSASELLASESFQQLVERLILLTQCLPDDEAPAIMEKFATSGLVDGFVDCLTLMQRDETTNEMLGFLLNASDASLPTCRAISECRRFFVDFCRPLLQRWADKRKLEPDVRQIVQYAVDICFNLYFKNDSEIYSRLAEHNLVDSVKPYLQNQCSELSTSALILIAFAVDERDAEVFLGAKTNISFLIGTLRKALKSSDRRCEGFSVSEAAKCINRLALNDVNKEILVKLDLLPVVRQMLSSSNSEDVSDGLEILFTLSFGSESAARIVAELKEPIDLLRSDSNWRENQTLRSLRFRLGIERPASAAQSQRRQQQQQQQQRQQRVMISYNHASRQLAERLYTTLKEAQLDVWIDYVHMREGSTLDLMSEAVDNSRVVLLCISRLYKESNNCRLEAEYAWKQQKKLIPVLAEPKFKATGWLGMLLGSQLYYDLTGAKYPFERKLPELLTAIKNQLAESASAGSRPTSAQLPPVTSSMTSPVTSRQHRLPPIGNTLESLRAWDADRVAKWCQENQLGDRLCAKRLTGQEVAFLALSARRSPEFFGRLLETQLGLNGIGDMAAVAMAIEDLHLI